MCTSRLESKNFIFDGFLLRRVFSEDQKPGALKAVRRLSDRELSRRASCSLPVDTPLVDSVPSEHIESFKLKAFWNALVAGLFTEHCSVLV